MINESISSVEDLRRAARSGLRNLADARPEAVWTDVCDQLRALGFEVGWGRTVRRIRESLELLQDVLEGPDPETFEALLARIPMVFRVATRLPTRVLRPGRRHGFARHWRSGRLHPRPGPRPRRRMASRLQEPGLDFEPQVAVITRLIPERRGTTADQRLEPIAGTRNARFSAFRFGKQAARSSTLDLTILGMAVS